MPLKAFDFVPAHRVRTTVFGTGDELCVIFMTGARREGA
jgi:hypothetical protein